MRSQVIDKTEIFERMPIHKALATMSAMMRNVGYSKEAAFGLSMGGV